MPSVAVIGASNAHNKYGNKAVRAYLRQTSGGPTQTDYKANFDNFHLVLNSATPVRLQQFDVE